MEGGVRESALPRADDASGVPIVDVEGGVRTSAMVGSDPNSSEVEWLGAAWWLWFGDGAAEDGVDGGGTHCDFPVRGLYQYLRPLCLVDVISTHSLAAAVAAVAGAAAAAGASSLLVTTASTGLFHVDVFVSAW